MTLDQVVTLVSAVIQASATVAVAVVLYRQTTRLKRIELTKQAQDAYNLVNQTALASDANLLALDSLGRPDADEAIELRRKRWCTFVWLQASQTTFMLNRNGLMDERYAAQTLQHQLELLLADDLVFQVLSGRGFHPDFVAHCSAIRSSIVRLASQRTALK